MRSILISVTSAVFMVATHGASQAALKQVPYTAVKVELTQPYTPNAAFEKLRAAFADAVAKKNTDGLFSLVGSTFVWLSQGQIGEQFDFGRDALHNFKVVFGFREAGKDVDGGVADGPFWDTMAEFAADKTFYVASASLVCGPTAATVVDEAAFERAKQRIGADESVEWYFVIADTSATATPAGTGAPVGRVSQVALPILQVNPPAVEGQPHRPPTHLQVLLPSGKSGWISAASARPLVTDRLCYSANPAGEWKITAFDQAE
jgi:hypothetical protein